MVRAKRNINKKNETKYKTIKLKTTLPNKKRKRIIKNRIINDNPRITSITLQSHFVYDIDTFENYFNSVKNKNLLKLNDEEYEFLKERINGINILKNDILNSSYISISKTIFDKISSYENSISEKDELSTYIKNFFETNLNRDCISCRKIASKYLSDTGKKVSKSRIHNILKNKLDLRYLKSTIKTKKIKDNRNILISLCYIKIIIKCLLLDFKLIFVDESKIQANNNNYRTWRKKDEVIYYNIENKKPKNLIAAVGENEIIYYEINDENTNENVFLNFMKNLKFNLEKLKIDKYAIILDNFAGHKTPSLLEYYKEKKLNIIFNSPYQSNFNSIELFFRLIKKKIYNKLYKSVDEVVNEMKNIINDKGINSSLKQNFRETLEEYLKFSLEFKDINLNNYDY